MKVINCQTLGEVCECMLDGEPVFLIRAQDKLAVEVISTYLETARQEKARNLGRVRDVLAKVVMWQSQNANKVKIPD